MSSIKKDLSGLAGYSRKMNNRAEPAFVLLFKEGGSSLHNQLLGIYGTVKYIGDLNYIHTLRMPCREIE